MGCATHPSSLRCCAGPSVVSSYAALVFSRWTIQCLILVIQSWYQSIDSGGVEGLIASANLDPKSVQCSHESLLRMCYPLLILHLGARTPYFWLFERHYEKELCSIRTFSSLDHFSVEPVVIHRKLSVLFTRLPQDRKRSRWQKQNMLCYYPKDSVSSHSIHSSRFSRLVYILLKRAGCKSYGRRDGKAISSYLLKVLFSDNFYTKPMVISVYESGDGSLSDEGHAREISSVKNHLHVAWIDDTN